MIIWYWHTNLLKVHWYYVNEKLTINDSSRTSFHICLQKVSSGSKNFPPYQVFSWIQSSEAKCGKLIHVVHFTLVLPHLLSFQCISNLGKPDRNHQKFFFAVVKCDYAVMSHTLPHFVIFSIYTWKIVFSRNFFLLHCRLFITWDYQQLK